MNLNLTQGSIEPQTDGAPSNEVVAPTIYDITPLKLDSVAEMPSKEPIPKRPLSIESMTNQQYGRYNLLLPYYGEQRSLLIVSLINPTGLNTWKSLLDKMDGIVKQDPDGESYLKLIRDGITLNAVYTIPKIIQDISRYRKSLSRSPYRRDILQDCLSDFLLTHMAEPIFLDKVNEKSGKPIVLGYKPVVDLMFEP